MNPVFMFIVVSPAHLALFTVHVLLTLQDCAEKSAFANFVLAVFVQSVKLFVSVLTKIESGCALKGM